MKVLGEPVRFARTAVRPNEVTSNVPGKPVRSTLPAPARRSPLPVLKKEKRPLPNKSLRRMRNYSSRHHAATFTPRRRRYAIYSSTDGRKSTATSAGTQWLSGTRIADGTMSIPSVISSQWTM